ncbi:MAG: saccharopine dehydrogenase NADP-binding domain-containing protein [Chloroflexi bacterium]|nr:saccharopine dehydrogenase NADP-binding domain-containing protein [Chloroflexota bacterium]
MAKVTLLGACGAVGSVAAGILVDGKEFSEIVLADMNLNKTRILASSFGSNRVTARAFDANDPESIKKVIKGSAVVLNCVGPFYEYGPKILKATIESKINYVDVCDDFDATIAMLKMDRAAKQAGISALVGMGSSPGMANVIVRFCAENLLDSVEQVDIYHAHGGEKVEGPAVVKHRIHSMEAEIPMFLKGKFTTVKLFEKSGKALEEVTDFADIGTYKVYGYPHPETITLPKYLKGVKRVTNLGLVLPPAYAELIKGMVKLGVTGEKAIEVQCMKVKPLEFAVAYILSQRAKLNREAGLTQAMGCLKIVVKGKKNGAKNTYIFQMSSKGKGMGEGTGIPAALGAIIMGTGKIKVKGVLPPEACVNPNDVLELIKTKIKFGGKSGGVPIAIQHINKDGKVSELKLF